MQTRIPPDHEEFQWVSLVLPHPLTPAGVCIVTLCGAADCTPHSPCDGPDMLTKELRHKSSRYVPIIETISARSSPLSSTAELPRKRDSKSKQQSESTKRRATMNSRGAYDEDEMLRRAIEESREMGTLGKRTRDDGSEE